MSVVSWGSGASQRQVQRAVEEYFRNHPPQPGTATDAQVSGAVSAYLSAHPPERGESGLDATPAQVATAVAAYLSANPPAPGANATPAQIAAAVSTYIAANPPAPGAPGAAGEVLLRQINVTDTATIAITLGTVDMQFPCAGAVVGERYKAHVRSHRLNNGTTLSGRPALYWVVVADCRVADTINIVHMRPAIVLGGKYELFTDIVKVNAS